MYLCTMIRQKYFCYAAILFIIVACGTSRTARKGSSSSAFTYQESVGLLDQTPSIPDGAQNRARKRKHVTLSDRLDSLLITADTLLHTTQLGIHILDLHTGQELYALNPRQRMRPASTEKVVTAIAALDILGPSYTLDTQLLTTAAVKGHTLQGDIYIKGVMDPLLTVNDLRTLANQLKAAGITQIQGRLLADASFKDDDEYGWGWCWDDENPTLSPLLVDGKPGLPAALRAAFSRAGITLTKGIASSTAPATARTLAAIHRPLTDVLQPMLKESDNLCAEAVFYQLGQSRRQIAPRIQDLLFRAYGISNRVETVAEQSSPSFTIADGSGLSLYNYQTPVNFTQLLAYAAVRPDNIFNPLLTALPIAAMDGTLKRRMADTPAAGNVRAKTGTVTAVSTLVGYTTQRSTGHLIAFAILSNGLPRMADGRVLQDKICILLSE